MIWLIGFIFYRWLMTVDIPVGNTLPDMAAVIVLCLIAEAVFGRKEKDAKTDKLKKEKKEKERRAQPRADRAVAGRLPFYGVYAIISQ